MKLQVSEVARVLNAEREEVKTWAFRFKDYLTAEANPPKAIPRVFSPEDLPVLAYVAYYWEQDPDLDSIKAGLNGGEHLTEPYTSVLTGVLPLFQEPPDDLDDTWRHGALIGGMTSEAFDTFAIADSYKLAGDVLVEAVPSRAEAYELLYPVMFNYRHAIELYLKAVLPAATKGHELRPLWEKLRVHLKHTYKVQAPMWFENLIFWLDDFDPESTTFRYSDTQVYSRSTRDGGEFWFDLPHARELMQLAAHSFQRIRKADKGRT